MNEIVSAERGSAIMQITGSISPEGRAVWLDRMAVFFNNPMFHHGVEAEKTDQQLEILEGILRWLPEFVTSFNGLPLALTPSHYHFANNIYAPKLIDAFNLSKAHGLAHIRRQEIWLNFFNLTSVVYLGDMLNFADTVVHEGLHFLAFNTFMVSREHPFEHDWSGLTYFNKNDRIFWLGNEAVTTELQRVYAKRYYPQIPLLARRVEETGRFCKYGSSNSSEKLDYPYVVEHLKLENLILKACLQLGYSREEILQTLGIAYFTKDWTGMVPIMHSFNSPDSIKYMNDLNGDLKLN